jgi:hypothetical protein
MTVTNSATSSDTPPQSKPPAPQGAAQVAAERWENEGGPLRDPPSNFVGPYTRKPAWSVLSLHDLNESVRLERRADDPARLAMEAGRAARAAARAAEALEDKVGAAARAGRDRHRNPWEHT